MAAVTAATQLEALLSLHPARTGQAPHVSIGAATVGNGTRVRLRTSA